jgi:hypothetical protein
MKIPVILVNGWSGSISCGELDAMLEIRMVAAFLRAAGWAVVGRDELRGARGAGGGSWRDRKARGVGVVEVMLPGEGWLKTAGDPRSGRS